MSSPGPLCKNLAADKRGPTLEGAQPCKGPNLARGPTLEEATVISGGSKGAGTGSLCAALSRARARKPRVGVAIETICGKKEAANLDGRFRSSASADARQRPRA